jgi:hypothetical protein
MLLQLTVHWTFAVPAEAAAFDGPAAALMSYCRRNCRCWGEMTSGVPHARPGRRSS